MNKSTKKVVAREFLFFLSTLILIGIIYLVCFYPYNWIQQSRIQGLENEINRIQSQIDTVEPEMRMKLQSQEWIFSQIKSKYDVTDTPYDTRERLWNAYLKSVNENTIVSKWNSSWVENGARDFYISLGFENPEEWKSFIVRNTFTKKDSALYNRTISSRDGVLELQNRKNVIINSKLDSTYDSSFILAISSLIVFGLLFFLRYLFYAVKWSIKQVRS